MGNYYESFEPPFFLWYQSPDRSIDINSHSYERPDQEIATDIVRTYGSLHHINAADVQVYCDHNVVVLKGHCQNQYVRRYLWALAENTLGVRHVVNEIYVDEQIRH